MDNSYPKLVKIIIGGSADGYLWKYIYSDGSYFELIPIPYYATKNTPDSESYTPDSESYTPDSSSIEIFSRTLEEICYPELSKLPDPEEIPETRTISADEAVFNREPFLEEENDEKT